MNTDEVNMILKNYTLYISNYLSKTMNLSHLKEYFKVLKTKQNYYLIIPLGIISDNPFLFNLGPNIFLSYDLINSPSLTIDLDVKNYGLNNVLVNIYLNINIDQKVLKPVLNKTNTHNYRFLISSKIVYGRVSPFIGGNITTSS